MIVLALLGATAAALLALYVRRRRPSARDSRLLRGCRIVLLVVLALLGAQALLGVPALAQVPGVEDCKQPPNPERPG
ncbi:MAG: hypothetical protein ACRDRM_03705, partial [Pseudonocardiaceae bacterium]